MCDRVILEFKQVVVYMCNYDTKAVERFQLFFLPFQYHPTAILEMYAWWMVVVTWREEWKCATMECGQLWLTTTGINGITIMLVWYVINWDSMIIVSRLNSTISIINIHIYTSTGATAITGSYFGTGNRSVIYRYILCSGSESSLQSCSKSTFSIYDYVDEWYNCERAAVECQAKGVNLTSENYRVMIGNY